MKKVTVLVPCYNEEDSIQPFYEELKKVLDNEQDYIWELLFVNDGSSDNTLNIIKNLKRLDPRICFVNLSRNFGKECAMLAGFDYATGDGLIILDADLQDPPLLIPKMLEYWEQGYQDVYAKREDRGKESYLRRSFSILFYKILDNTTRFDVLPNVGDFRLLDRACINALRQLRETERYTKGMYCWIGFKKKEILFNRGNRIAGKSNWNFLSLFNLAVEGITSFTTAPLRFATIIGTITATGSFCFLLFYICKKIIFGDPVQGFTTLVSITLFLGGIQMLTIGILGEYISRIFNETKKRPPYLVAEYSEE